MDVETFAAERTQRQDDAIEAVTPAVDDALSSFGDPEWYQPVVDAALEVRRQLTTEGEEEFIEGLIATIENTSPPSETNTAQSQTIATWVAVYAINDGTYANLEPGQRVEWITQRDDDVREVHRPLDGVARDQGEPFTVAGVEVPYPGAPVGPLDIWMNCRCHLRPVEGGDMPETVTAAGEFDLEPEMVDDVSDYGFSQVPIHGVLVDRSEETGDNRHLAGELSVLAVEGGPVPLRWVKFDKGRHDDAVRVATITATWEEGPRILFDGHLMNTFEADEVTNLLAEGRMGLSVDLDSAVTEMAEGSNGEEMQVVTSGRIRAATLVDIPALVGAWAALGSWGDTAGLAASGCAPCQEQMADYRPTYAISEADWDGSSSRFTDEEWCRSTIVDLEEGCTSKEQHKMPIREPNGDLSRAAVHNAAARFNQVDAPASALATARRRLRAAYRELGEEPPEVITAAGDVETFQVPGIPAITQDAPGWLTEPGATARLRRYWTEGPGAAKIGWGTPGDFNRCRSQLRKYVRNPEWLAGTCANMHFDALGIWPGQHTARVASEHAVTASAFTVVDEVDTLPAAWFDDPNLPVPTPPTVTREGRVFGHIAAWETCHTGLGLSVGRGKSCVTAPHSPSNYAYFLTGVVDTDGGERRVGQLTMGIGHADDQAGAMPAASHYDNVNAAIADVTVGEDEHGIWFSGAMRPNLTDEQVRAFKASELSGDWRTIGGEYEMVAALTVNVPGFPIPRSRMGFRSGRQVSLLAAGIVHRPEEPEKPLTASAEDIAREVVKVQQRSAKAAALKEEFAKSQAKYISDRRAALAEKIGEK